jgi:hypothetical protein
LTVRSGTLRGTKNVPELAGKVWLFCHQMRAKDRDYGATLPAPNSLYNPVSNNEPGVCSLFLLDKGAHGEWRIPRKGCGGEIRDLFRLDPEPLAAGIALAERC